MAKQHARRTRRWSFRQKLSHVVSLGTMCRLRRHMWDDVLCHYVAVYRTALPM